MSYRKSQISNQQTCFICGSVAGFRIQKHFSLREAKCPVCSASKRNNDLAGVILSTLLGKEDLSLIQALPLFEGHRIFEAQNSGPIHDILISLPGYISSEYFENVSGGSIHESGVRSENLENLSFPENWFDLVITQDVMEHVRNPDRAFGEIHRVLKPDGWHIFTVPFHEGKATRRRIKADGTSSVSFLLPAVYHGDPLNPDGVLVCTDFGDDIIDYLNSIGFLTEIAQHSKFYHAEDIPYIVSEISYNKYLKYRAKSQTLRYLKYNSVVFKSQKITDHTIASLEFTGERYIPNIKDPQISHEHWHRYLYATQFVGNKRVLDIASGEGYGANLLAETAKSVIGVDIDERTVSHAQMKYKGENLEFKIGSVTNIPIDVANTFDVVVSFETIEHLDDESQRAFIKEAKRILKPLGLFIVSTPNHLTYSEIPRYVNEFHKKEFYESEFETFMKGYFQKVVIVGQKIQASSYIWPKNENTGTMVEYSLTYNSEGFSPSSCTKDMTYIIAICSDGELNDPSFSVLFDESESLVHEQLRAALTKLSNSEEALNSIYTSHGWHILEKLYNTRNKVLALFNKGK